MNITHTIMYNPRRALPDDDAERAAWLDEHGLPPTTTELTIVASATEWIEAGISIDANGAAVLAGKEGIWGYQPGYRDAILEIARDSIRETGELPGPYSAVELAAAHAVVCAAEAAKAEELKKERAEKEALINERRADLEAALDRLDVASITALNDRIPGLPHRRYGGAFLFDGDGEHNLEWITEIPVMARDLGRDDIAARAETRVAEIRLEEAGREKIKTASAEAWAGWARERGSEDLRIAIRDGYPLGERVERELEDALFPPAPARSVAGPSGIRDDGERRVPRAAARAVREALLDAVDESLLPFGTELVVGRIRSISWYEACDCAGDDWKCDDCDDDREVAVRATAVMVEIVAAHHRAARWYVVEE